MSSLERYPSFSVLYREVPLYSAGCSDPKRLCQWLTGRGQTVAYNTSMEAHVNGIGMAVPLFHIMAHHCGAHSWL